MGTRRLSRTLAPLSLVLAVLATLGACQAIFTYTPLGVFQRDPATLSPAEQLTYAQNALASGDRASMLAAYAAIKSDTSNAGSYTAAQLAVEISGVPELIVAAISDPASLTGASTSVTDFLTAHPAVNPSYLVAAAARLAALPPADLTPMDYVYGGLGLALDAATVGGVINFAAADPTKMAAAKAFVQYAVDNVVNTLAPTDPVYLFMDAYNTYIHTF